jgi:hypothetical protein
MEGVPPTLLQDGPKVRIAATTSGMRLLRADMILGKDRESKRDGCPPFITNI